MYNLLEDSIKIQEPENIANILFYLYQKQYTCHSIKKKKWYKISKNNLIEIEDGYELYRLISTDINHIFQKYQLELEERIIRMKKEKVNIDNNEEIKRLCIYVNKCDNLLKKLKNYTFKNKIMKEASILFYEEKK